MDLCFSGDLPGVISLNFPGDEVGEGVGFAELEAERAATRVVVVTQVGEVRDLQQRGIGYSGALEGEHGGGGRV